EAAPVGTRPAPSRPPPLQPSPIQPPPLQPSPQGPGLPAVHGHAIDLPALPEAEVVGPFDPIPWQTQSEGLHRMLSVPGSSEHLSQDQVDDAFLVAGRLNGVPTELLEHTAHVEASDNQRADGGPAHGLMQIEKSQHHGAYQGARNVGNDTTSNIL